MYEQLTVELQLKLRNERLLALEADHFRTVLELGELPEDESAAADRQVLERQLHELTRRAALYRPDIIPAPAPAPVVLDPEAMLDAIPDVQPKRTEREVPTESPG